MAQEEFWNRLKKKLREVSTAAADLAEEQALIGKLKFDILSLKRKIDHEQSDLGARIVEMSRATPPPTGVLADLLVKRHISEVEALEKEVAQKRDDIGKVADLVRSRRPATEPSPSGKAEPHTSAVPRARKKATGKKKGPP